MKRMPMLKIMKVTLIKSVLASLFVLVILSGCGASQEKTLLEKYKLASFSIEELVEHLEYDEKIAKELKVQIFPNEIKLTDGKLEQVVDIKSELFYLSMAPYTNETHPCTYHIPTGCQGELVGETFSIKVVGADGTIYADQQLTTAHNGFAGLWLPRDIKATVYIENANGVAQQEITTFADSLTCLTTLKLQ